MIAYSTKKSISETTLASREFDYVSSLNRAMDNYTPRRQVTKRPSDYEIVNNPASQNQ